MLSSIVLSALLLILLLAVADCFGIHEGLYGLILNP